MHGTTDYDKTVGERTSALRRPVLRNSGDSTEGERMGPPRAMGDKMSGERTHGERIS